MDDVSGMVLWRKGAEADLFLADWHGRRVVLKRRLPKKYRVAALDVRVRGYRTVHEPLLMNLARRAGVPTPVVFLVDRGMATIVMEFVEGRQLKQVLGVVSGVERRRLCFRVGMLVGLLHGSGLVHGDLTTSNMIVGSDGRVVFVDFGLGERSAEVEARGVDVHLMRRAFESVHFRFADECFDSVMDGYAKVLGGEAAKEVLVKVGEIERRGRYVAERRMKP